jgi:dihydrofolate reductase
MDTEALMGKVIAFNMATLDGFFAGPDGEIDWHHVDEEFNEFAIAQLNSAGGLLFGRVTYQGMAGYWPTDVAIKNDPVVADKMNTLPKIVFSRTLEKVDWNNTRQVKGNIPEEISKLKQQPGKDWLLFGSADLASTLMNYGLIDEYRVMVNPVVLGSGKPLFKGVKDRLELKLASAKTFRNGNVLLCYQPDGKE